MAKPDNTQGIAPKTRDYLDQLDTETGNIPQEAVSDVTTGDASGGTYGSSEETLLNECKSTINSILTELRDAGIINP
jgi:hypothetical protein